MTGIKNKREYLSVVETRFSNCSFHILCLSNKDKKTYSVKVTNRLRFFFP